MKNTRLRFKGFSLAEILLSMALFTMLITSVGVLANDAVRATKNSSERIVASQYLQEMSNALIQNKDNLWGAIISNTGIGPIHLTYNEGKYQFTPGSITKNGVTLSTTITDVYRDTNGNIVTSGGTLDTHTRSVLLLASWIDFLGLPNEISTVTYVSDWATLRLSQTSVADFETGTNNSTLVRNNAGGEVVLAPVLFADWCKPGLTQTTHDLPGQGIAKSLYVTQGNIYMGTGSNASGVSFARLSFTPVEPPVVSSLGTFDGYKTNAIFAESNYGYLATQTNSKEVVIVNMATSPYTEIGYFNPSVNSQGRGIYVNGSTGFVATDTRLYSFNLSAKTGARPVISYINLQGTVVDMFARGNYAYIALSNSVTELEIIDLSNPSSMRSIGKIDLNTQSAKTVYVNEAETRAYVGTTVSVTQPELFIVDVTSKTGTKYPFSSYDTKGMAPIDITAPEGANRVIVVGSGGSEQYQVVSLDNETKPVYCGGLALPQPPNAVFSMIETNGNAYSYIVTSEASTELRIIRGGPGGGNSQGQGYANEGEYISRIFDTNSATTQYYSLDWGGTIPASATVRIQVRASNTATLNGASWIGADGTSNTYFTSQQIMTLPAQLNNNRYFQYRVLFTSDTLSTPEFANFELTYQK